MAEAHSGITSFGGWQREAAGYARAAAPVLTQLNSRLPLMQEHVFETLVYSPASHGAAHGLAPQSPLVMGKRVGGPILCRGNYGGLNGLIAATMGHEAMKIGNVLMPEEIGSGAYRHLFELNTDWQGVWHTDEGAMLDNGLTTDKVKPQRGTFAMYKTFGAWEFSGIAPNTMTLHAPRMDAVEITFDTIGYEMVRPATVNTNMLHLPPQQHFPMLPSHFVWTMGDYSTTVALTPQYVWPALPWTLTVENFLDHGYSPAFGVSPGVIDRAAPVAVRVEFTVPRYYHDLLYEWYRYQILLMAHAKWTGPFIPGSGGINWGLRCYFPACRIQDISYGTTPAHTELTCVLSVESPSATPAGFPAVSHPEGPLQIEAIVQAPNNQFL